MVVCVRKHTRQLIKANHTDSLCMNEFFSQCVLQVTGPPMKIVSPFLSREGKKTDRHVPTFYRIEYAENILISDDTMWLKAQLVNIT